MQLLVTIGLYTVLVSFISLVFGLINTYFPDSAGYYQAESLRFPIAALIVVFPLYAFFTKKLQKEALEDTEKKNLKTRKWLFYLTLSLAAIVAVVDVIVLLFNFLDGGLTAQFLLKILTVLLASAVVFKYYLWNLKEDTLASSDKRMKYLVYGSVILVAAAIIAGFLTIGTPGEQRARKFDEQRIHALQGVQANIIEYWRTKDILPGNLSDVEDSIIEYKIPVDPETKEQYEYKVTGELSFQLCANFSTEMSPEMIERYSLARPAVEIGGNWEYAEGRTCFERTIDPERIKPTEEFPTWL